MFLYNKYSDINCLWQIYIVDYFGFLINWQRNLDLGKLKIFLKIEIVSIRGRVYVQSCLILYFVLVYKIKLIFMILDFLEFMLVVFRVIIMNILVLYDYLIYF